MHQRLKNVRIVLKIVVGVKQRINLVKVDDGRQSLYLLWKKRPRTVRLNKDHYRNLFKIIVQFQFRLLAVQTPQLTQSQQRITREIYNVDWGLLKNTGRSLPFVATTRRKATSTPTPSDHWSPLQHISQYNILGMKLRVSMYGSS